MALCCLVVNAFPCLRLVLIAAISCPCPILWQTQPGPAFAQALFTFDPYRVVAMPLLFSPDCDPGLFVFDPCRVVAMPAALFPGL
jgi:hypothetical protein